jgi:small subunit ribosomal protein S1
MADNTDFKQTSKTSNKEFESLLAKDFKDRKLKENEIIKATVTEIGKSYVIVDAKAKAEAMIPIEEFKNDDELKKLKVGSTIDVYLERIENFKGEIVISREKARRMVAWKKMEKIFENQEIIEGYITGKIKGGYICTVNGLPTFMPASQIDVRPLKKIDHLMNVPVKVIATRIDRSRGNVCTSRRAVLEKDKNAEVKEMLKNIKEGDIVNNAKVKATTDWGVFLDINGLDALLHVSDLSHGRVKKPSELVTIGQNIKVKITKIDKSTNRISASIKALTEDPYENISKKYKIGEVYEGTCTKLMDYGAFVKLEEGVEGLIHNSELSWESKNVNPSKILSVSEKIKVKIVSIEQENKRISLSYKATLENPWNDVKKQIGSIIDVKIKNVTEKGIFATLENGLTGMVFYRDVSYNDQEQDLSKFKKNESIKVKVIDVKDEKIKLSIKALDKDPMDYLKDNNKKVGDIITTRIHSVMANGVKVSIDPDKKLIATIKKAELAKDSSDARPEVFSKGNALDAKIMDLNYDKRKIVLSVKAAQIEEEKSLVAKFGKGAKAGATLKSIFEKALSGRKKKK